MKKSNSIVRRRFPRNATILALVASLLVPAFLPAEEDLAASAEDERWRDSLKPKPGKQAANAVRVSRDKDASPMFRRMDTNGDRKVTREEFLGLWTEAFRNQDKDGDGMLNVSEFGHPASFKNADSDQNGKATLTEFETMYSNQFDGLDKNKDALLTIDEL